MSADIRIGVAGWTVPSDLFTSFANGGSALERYASRFACVEINSSFYRPHRPATYARWAAATPSTFRFAVKAPKAVTHQARLVGCEAALAVFLGEAAHLGDKLGPILVQLPPSLAFEPDVAEDFFARMRRHHGGPVVCEPRHPTWFAEAADRLLTRHEVARAAADPAAHPLAALPGGWTGLSYRRWHGSPRMYFSPYDEAAIAGLAESLRAETAAQAWCLFDNTGAGWASRNALALLERVGDHGPRRHQAAGALRLS